MWLVAQQVAPAATCVERTYAEIVQVVRGRALVQERSTVEFLHTCGYAVVEELPPLEELMRQNPGHVINLGREGLGPLAGRKPEELDALQAELDETGRVVELQGPLEVVVMDDPEPEPTLEELTAKLAAVEAELTQLQADHAALQGLFQQGAEAAAARMAALQEPAAPPPAETEQPKPTSAPPVETAVKNKRGGRKKAEG